MSQLCVSAALLLLLGTLVAGTRGCEERSQMEELPPAFCLEPSHTGPCRAQMTRYFYNVRSGGCEEFIYGGCDAQRNNFEELEDCVRTCGAWRDFRAPVLPRDAEV
uniref:BPTI/Kunitz inhibitor domain-containing protein n=1 Tax=Catagonus wagneri TaxID=51154 RepID=A0A8C3VWI5_9CETA